MNYECMRLKGILRCEYFVPIQWIATSGNSEAKKKEKPDKKSWVKFTKQKEWGKR